MTTNKGKSVQDELRESAHRVWLAGLGALSAAEEEGSKLFQRLVERGEKLEAKGKEQAGKVKGKVGGAWEDLGDKLDEQVGKALHRLGVPTRDEIRKLTRRVEELSSKVDHLHGKKASAKEA
jgi:polyhydroxyalkanoate synthesis regulator phasin